MKAIYLSSKSGPEGLVAGEIRRPNPKDDEVLVKVHATSVSPREFDWFTTFNLPFGEPRPFPIVLGHEFSGMVESVGAAVTGFYPGDEVFGLNDWFMNGVVEPRVRDAFMRVQLDDAQLARIGGLTDQGEIKTHFGPVFPLTAPKLAYARARHGLRRGKIALRVLDLEASSNGETQN